MRYFERQVAHQYYKFYASLEGLSVTNPSTQQIMKYFNLKKK